MTKPLWTWDSLVPAAIGVADGTPTQPITGFSIDTRSLAPGEVFVALRDVRDGHDFVLEAFRKGAAAALVEPRYRRVEGDGALLRVADTLQGLRNIAAAARRRTDARIVAVTGSVGKTGTKEALRACLSRLGPTHAAEKSFNNHWGVPLTLARMPADVRYGVFEIGMNHAGEITPLTALVRPHVAIVTTVEPVHLEFFGTTEKIAEAKAEIFGGLEPGGIAILNRDNAHFELLAQRAREHGAKIVSFGRHENADVCPEVFSLDAEGSDVTVRVSGRLVAYRLGAPGAHLAQNSLAVIAALDALGADVERAVGAFADMRAAKGRGERRRIAFPDGPVLLIDESYNANPASMRATLAQLGATPASRRIAVLGSMKELGDFSPAFHAQLAEPLEAARVDFAILVGEEMGALARELGKPPNNALGIPLGFAHCQNPGEAIAALEEFGLAGGDAVLVKGSNSVGLGRVVAHFATREG